MSILDGIARPFWLAGLNEVAGPQIKGIGGLICDEAYQIYSQVSPRSFTLSFSDPKPILSAFAADINRIGSASFESSLSISRSKLLPKSTAWLVIQTYYSAFFSAHAILRILGESCTPIEREHVNSIVKVGELFGAAPLTPMAGGLYHLVCDAKERTISGKSLSGSPHEAFWKVFYDRILRLSNEALTVPTQSVADRQRASVKLGELASNLCFQSAATGRWLSTVRNSVNYSQKHATWFPYSGHRGYHDYLFEKISEWTGDPLDLDLVSCGDKDLRRFQVTCNFIIGSLRSISVDMADRCTVGRSFQNFGSLGCLNRARRSRL